MQPLTSFIGREKERLAIEELLSQPNCRLLTIIGPGGTGKTRLALQVAGQVKESYANGVVVVDLQPLRSPDFFVAAVAEALGIALSGTRPGTEQVGAYLADKQFLIVLDNFEHVLDAATDLLELLHQAPQATYLATSREALNVQEEWLYPLGGLAVPTTDDPAGFAQCDAIKLFCERAKQVYPEFTLEEEANAIRRICQLVDGMPLALELAASWRRSLTCQTIVAEIERDLTFLSTRLRNVPQRHRSIQAIFDHTWKQMTHEEQETFKMLSVFRGGFEREAARKVAGANTLTLAGLVDRSLLRVDPAGRYHIHELLRQYAAEQLEQNPQQVQLAEIQHTAYYVDLLHASAEGIQGANQLRVLQTLKRELDNVRLLWLRLLEQMDGAIFQKIGPTVGHFYQYAGNYLEGVQFMTQARDALKALPPSRESESALLIAHMCQSWFNLRFGRLQEIDAAMAESQAIYARWDIPPLPHYLSDPNAMLSLVALVRGDYQTAIARSEQVRLEAERHPHPANHQYAYYLLSEGYLGLGEYETAYGWAKKAYTLIEAAGNRWRLAYLLNSLGQLAINLGDLNAAETHFQESYAIREELGDPEGMAIASINLGNLALKRFAYDSARGYFERSCAIYHNINDTGGLATSHRGQGRVAIGQQQFAQAQTHLHDALQAALSINYRPVLIALLVDIAELLWQTGQGEQSLGLLTFVLQHPAGEHETKTQAKEKLATYKLQLKRWTGTVPAGALSDVCTTLLNELSQPYTEETRPDKSANQTATQPLIDPLTPRELDVLQLICEGYSNPEIATELILSVGTIKFHTNRIFGKLSVRNRVEAVTQANKLKLLEP